MPQPKDKDWLNGYKSKTSIYAVWGFPGGSDGKASVCNAGDLGSIPGSGRSPGEGNGNPLQFCCLENPMDRGAWYATVHGVTKSRTRLRNLNLLIYAVYKRPTSNLGKHID